VLDTADAVIDALHSLRDAVADYVLARLF